MYIYSICTKEEIAISLFLCLDLVELFEDGVIERKGNGDKGKPPVLTYKWLKT